MYKTRLKFTLDKSRHPIPLKQHAFDNKVVPLQRDWSQRWCSLVSTFDETGCLAEMLQMEVRKEDVFVITFMKSGTTWMMETAWLLKNNLNFAMAKELQLNGRVPFLE